jgi:large conductance mechanosensitive channel protein
MSETKPVKTEEVTKVVAAGETIRIEAPSGSHVTKRKHQRMVVDLVSPDEFVGGFIDFLREHAIVGLAVGFAIGTQAQSLVKTLVSSFIDPLFQLLFGGALSKQTFTLHFRSHHANFGWGSFVYGLLDFIFVLAAIYFIIKVFNLDKLDKPKIVVTDKDKDKEKEKEKNK